MKLFLLSLVIASLVLTCYGQEYEGDDKVVSKQEEEEKEEESGWWANFKRQVKSVLTKWRDDLKGLWNQVLAKASDMRSWTADMFENFKLKLREWLETRPEVPDDEKNEIETFISKLKLPTEKPKEVDP